MNPLRSQRKNSAEQAGHGPKIATERSFLVLRWHIEEVASAIDSAGLVLEDLLVKHVVPRLEATKTLRFAYHGQLVEKHEVPDHHSQLEVAILLTRLFYPDK